MKFCVLYLVVLWLSNKSQHFLAFLSKGFKDKRNLSVLDRTEGQMKPWKWLSGVEEINNHLNESWHRKRLGRKIHYLLTARIQVLWNSRSFLSQTYSLGPGSSLILRTDTTPLKAYYCYSRAPKAVGYKKQSPVFSPPQILVCSLIHCESVAVAGCDLWSLTVSKLLWLEGLKRQWQPNRILWLHFEHFHSEQKAQIYSSSA